jgi:solute carrier family 25 (mitochondrial oxoglutarate transporter), member 11
MSSVAATIQPFFCGGLSACIASTVVHPLDLAKVRLQLLNSSTVKPSFVTLLSSMIKEEGIMSIYAGLSASYMRQAIYGTARIGLHRTFSDMLIERNNGKALSFGAKVGSGMLAGSIAVMLGTPCDVALVRMQGDSMRPVNQRRGYKNAIDAVVRVAREEGVAVLYSGLLPNILRGMSMNAGMLACYDQAKEMICEFITMEDPGHATMKTRMMASIIAGFTASLFSLPFDLVKSRLQDGGRYKGVADAAITILMKEGPLAFWTGLLPYYMRVAPHAMMLLMLSDPITSLYIKTFRSSEQFKKK